MPLKVNVSDKYSVIFVLGEITENHSTINLKSWKKHMKSPVENELPLRIFCNAFTGISVLIGWPRKYFTIQECKRIQNDIETSIFVNQFLLYKHCESWSRLTKKPPLRTDTVWQHFWYKHFWVLTLSFIISEINWLVRN